MNRRYILTRIVQAFTVVGGLFVAYPFVRSVLPKVEPERLEVDVSDLAPGEWLKVTYRGRPVTITRRRSLELMAEVELKDPASEASQQPDFARSPHRSLREDYLVVIANCTHLGCEVSISDRPGIGFECPCHQSRFDGAGRVFKKDVASFNLEVPNYRFISRSIIELLPS